MENPLKRKGNRNLKQSMDKLLQQIEDLVGKTPKNPERWQTFCQSMQQIADENKILDVIHFRDGKILKLLYQAFNSCEKSGHIGSLDEILECITMLSETDEGCEIGLQYIKDILDCLQNKFYNFSTSLEICKHLNVLLSRLPKSKVTQLKNANMFDRFLAMFGELFFKAGDYDLQATLTEAVSRILETKEKEQFAEQWFKQQSIRQAFLSIENQNFESGCRNFINKANESNQEDRSVYSISCNGFFLGMYKLHAPNGSNDFWVDFNIQSKSLTSFIRDDANKESDDPTWETVVIKVDYVRDIRINDSGNDLTLILKLTMPACDLVPFCPKATEHYAKISFAKNHTISTAVSKLFGEVRYVELPYSNSSISSTPTKASTAKLPCLISSKNKTVLPGSILSKDSKSLSKVSKPEIALENPISSEFSNPINHEAPAEANALQETEATEKPFPKVSKDHTSDSNHESSEEIYEAEKGIACDHSIVEDVSVKSLDSWISKKKPAVKSYVKSRKEKLSKRHISKTHDKANDPLLPILDKEAHKKTGSKKLIQKTKLVIQPRKTRPRKAKYNAASPFSFKETSSDDKMKPKSKAKRAYKRNINNNATTYVIPESQDIMVENAPLPYEVVAELTVPHQNEPVPLEAQELIEDNGAESGHVCEDITAKRKEKRVKRFGFEEDVPIYENLDILEEFQPKLRIGSEVKKSKKPVLKKKEVKKKSKLKSRFLERDEDRIDATKSRYKWDSSPLSNYAEETGNEKEAANPVESLIKVKDVNKRKKPGANKKQKLKSRVLQTDEDELEPDGFGYEPNDDFANVTTNQICNEAKIANEVDPFSNNFQVKETKKIKTSTLSKKVVQKNTKRGAKMKQKSKSHGHEIDIDVNKCLNERDSDPAVAVSNEFKNEEKAINAVESFARICQGILSASNKSITVKLNENSETPKAPTTRNENIERLQDSGVAMDTSVYERSSFTPFTFQKQKSFISCTKKYTSKAKDDKEQLFSNDSNEGDIEDIEGEESLEETEDYDVGPHLSNVPHLKTPEVVRNFRSKCDVTIKKRKPVQRKVRQPPKKAILINEAEDEDDEPYQEPEKSNRSKRKRQKSDSENELEDLDLLETTPPPLIGRPFSSSSANAGVNSLLEKLRDTVGNTMKKKESDLLVFTDAATDIIKDKIKSISLQQRQQRENFVHEIHFKMTAEIEAIKEELQNQKDRQDKFLDMLLKRHKENLQSTKTTMQRVENLDHVNSSFTKGMLSMEAEHSKYDAFAADHIRKSVMKMQGKLVNESKRHELRHVRKQLNELLSRM